MRLCELVSELMCAFMCVSVRLCASGCVAALRSNAQLKTQPYAHIISLQNSLIITSNGTYKVTRIHINAHHKSHKRTIAHINAHKRTS